MLNASALNGSSINGSTIDSEIRSQVTCSCYAMAVSLARVKMLGVVSTASSAIITGAVGRVMVRNLVGMQAAATGNITGRVLIRSIVSMTASVYTSITVFFVRAVVQAVARAMSSVTARVHINPIVNSVASAAATVIGRSLRRAIFTSVDRASIGLHVTVWERDYWRDPVRLIASASASVKYHLATLLKAHSTPAAGVVAKSLVLVRAPVSATAQATAALDYATFKRIPWDEPAPQDRVFMVSPGIFTFIVR